MKLKKTKPTKDEKALAVLEKKAWRGFRGFQETMLALQEIYNRELYKLVADNWSAYLKTRLAEWGEKRRVNQLRAAFAVFANVAKVGTVVPTSEAQLRPLVGVSADEQRSAWVAAAASTINGDPTAQRVKDALAKLAEHREKLARETAEERLQKIRQEEADALREPSADDGMRAAVAQGLRLLGRAKKVFARVGPPAEDVVEAIEDAEVKAGMMSV